MRFGCWVHLVSARGSREKRRLVVDPATGGGIVKETNSACELEAQGGGLTHGGAFGERSYEACG
jgi:hypothetical protein